MGSSLALTNRGKGEGRGEEEVREGRKCNKKLARGRDVEVALEASGLLNTREKVKKNKGKGQRSWIGVSQMALDKQKFASLNPFKIASSFW